MKDRPNKIILVSRVTLFTISINVTILVPRNSKIYKLCDNGNLNPINQLHSMRKKTMVCRCLMKLLATFPSHSAQFQNDQITCGKCISTQQQLRRPKNDNFSINLLDCLISKPIPQTNCTKLMVKIKLKNVEHCIILFDVF